MTDLSITYEDGLRLSELSGELEGLRYQLDHIFAVNAGVYVGVAAITILILVLMFIFCNGFTSRPYITRFEKENDAKEDVTMFWTYKVLKPIRTEEVTHKTYSYLHDRVDAEVRERTLPMEVEWVPRAIPMMLFYGVLPIAIFAAEMVAMTIVLNANIEMQMVDVQTQIDTIMAKYEAME